MPITRVQDHAADVVECVLYERASEHDDVRFEVITAMSSCDNEECPGEAMLIVNLSLSCPELANSACLDARATAQQGLPVDVASSEAVREMVDSMWDSMVAMRLEHANGLTG